MLALGVPLEDNELESVHVEMLKGVVRHVEPQVGDVGDGDGHQLLDELQTLLRARNRSGKRRRPVRHRRRSRSRRRRRRRSGGGHCGHRERLIGDDFQQKSFCQFFVVFYRRLEEEFRGSGGKS